MQEILTNTRIFCCFVVASYVRETSCLAFFGHISVEHLLYSCFVTFGLLMSDDATGLY